MVQNSEIKNYEELSENEIFEKVKEEITPIQENLSEKKITVDEAKAELKKINEWLQGSNLEKKNKKRLGKAFEKLNNLEKNIDQRHLKDEVDKITSLLKLFTKKELVSLKYDVQKRKHKAQERPTEVKNGLNKASKKLEETISTAENDKNPIARIIGGRMKKLMS